MTATAMPEQRPGRSKQDYGTPWDFIHAVEARFGMLTADLACTTKNAKAPRGYYFDLGRDALALPWAEDYPRGNLWLNPEFANITPWAEKCAVESTKRLGFIHMLVPASIGSNWFADHVRGKAYVEGVAPRMAFEGCADPYPKDLLLATYGYGLSGFGTWRWR